MSSHREEIYLRTLLLFTIAVTATIGGGVPDVSAAVSGYETSLVERVTAAFSEPLASEQVRHTVDTRNSPGVA